MADRPSPATTKPPTVTGTPAAPASFESLLEPLLDSAFGTALRFTRNRADAEDLVQEAALLAYRGFGSFEPGSSFRAWFFRILTNAYFTKYRKRKREGIQVELDDAPDIHLYLRTAELGLHDRAEDPASLLMSKVATEHVEAAIAALPDEYRVAATLYFMQDFSYQEIADVVGVPVGTIRSRIHRGRRLLQKALWTIAEERGIVSALGARGDEGD